MYLSQAPKDDGQKSTKQFNRATGNIGEAIAVAHLKKNGFSVVDTNFKNKIGELDIIATKNKRYHFIEVKYRRTNKYGTGLDAVTASKQRTIRKVATTYLVMKKIYCEVDTSFDVIAIMGDERDYSLQHLEACF